MIRVGLIGCGFIGTVHSFALQKLTRAGLVDARVVATFDSDAGRAATIAAHHGAESCRDLSTLLDDVDVAWICTWTAAHREAIESAVARERAVFCEKPLAPNLAEAERIAASLQCVPHQVGLVLRHAPVFRALADALKSGKYGRPMATILRDDQCFPVQGMYASDWRADVVRAGGGTLIEHSIHDVDLLRWVLGEPREVGARAGSLLGHEGIDDTTVLTFSYDDGSTATIVSVWHQILTRGSTRRLEVFCEEGLLWLDDDYLGPLHIETSSGTEVIAPQAPQWIDELDVAEEFAKPLGQYAAPSKAFLDTLASDGAAARGEPSAIEALAAHQIVDLAYRSARGGGGPLPVA